MASTPRLLQPDDAWERESRRSQRALLSAEQETLNELDAAAERATIAVIAALSAYQTSESAKMVALAVVQRAAEQYRVESTAAIVNGRQAARVAALERLRGELERASRQLGVDPIQVPPQSDAAEDAAFGQAAGDGLAGTWRAGVASAVLSWADDPKNSLSERVRLVKRGAAYRRQRAAATEISRAFNDEHGEGLAWVAQNYAPTGQRLVAPDQAYAFGRSLVREERLRRALRRGPEGVPFVDDADVADAEVDELPAWARPLVGHIVQRWDATLDAKTCSFCHSMNGALTLLGKPFSNGYEPGMPHPNCRCLSTIIVLTPQVIIENEKRAALKAKAVLKFEREVVARSVQVRAAKQALVRVAR